MMSHNDPTGTYTVTARVLHWLIAIIVLTAIPMGIAMGRVGEGPLADRLYDLHRSLGALLIPLVIIRLWWRAGHTPPPLPLDIPAPQRFAATAVHFLLYAALVAQPLVGWVATSAYRAPITVFWLIPLPPIWPENRAFSEMLFGLHKYIGIAMVVLLAMHIGGALFHHFIRRDRVLMRMISGA